MNENMDKEAREAYVAGQRALGSLRQAGEMLRSSRNWGIFDMLGGGMISTLIKHSKMNDAQECIRRAARDLRAFEKEMRDVDLPNVEIDGLLTFADFFFDGMLADLLVQKRIGEAREKVEDAEIQVEMLLKRLENTGTL